MYICLCNRLTDRQILSQSQGSTCSVEALYQSLGVKVRCGKCLPFAREILEVSIGTCDRTAVAAD
jgi:bacterioferritin-associated ferredoxin